jgi:hypothetical protein
MREPTDDLHPTGIGETAAERQQYQAEYGYYLRELLENDIPPDRAKPLAASMATKAVRGEALSSTESNALTGLDFFTDLDDEL